MNKQKLRQHSIQTSLQHQNAKNFRLTEISKYLKEINSEIEHYRLVLKKYKKVRKVIHYSVVCLGAMTTVLSSGAVATSLTGLGALVGVPLGGIAIFFRRSICCDVYYQQKA